MAKPIRKPARAVELDDIISSNILGADSDLLAVVLKTHLAPEGILIEMIRTFRSDDEPYRLSFPAKI